MFFFSNRKKEEVAGAGAGAGVGVGVGANVGTAVGASGVNTAAVESSEESGDKRDTPRPPSDIDSQV